VYDFLEGEVAQRSAARLVLDVGGVGYELAVPLGSSFPSSGRARAWTHLVVREDAHLLFGDGLVEGNRFGLKIALRHIFGLEVMVVVLAAHQRRPVALANGLLQPCRDIADRETNAPIIGAIGFRSME